MRVARGPAHAGAYRVAGASHRLRDASALGDGDTCPHRIATQRDPVAMRTGMRSLMAGTKARLVPAPGGTASAAHRALETVQQLRAHRRGSDP